MDAIVSSVGRRRIARLGCAHPLHYASGMKKQTPAKKLNLKTLTVADLLFVSGSGVIENGQKEGECKTGDTEACKKVKS